MIKIRKQIYIDSEDVPELEKEGKRNTCSVSEIIRMAIKDYLRRKKKSEDWLDDPLTKAFGQFPASSTDISGNHDKYLYDE
jgi:hypothetical protein